MGFWKKRNRDSGKYTWLWGTLVGVICIAVGAWDGQLAVIWKKAVMICLECIGIG